MFGNPKSGLYWTKKQLNRINKINGKNKSKGKPIIVPCKIR